MVKEMCRDVKAWMATKKQICISILNMILCTNEGIPLLVLHTAYGETEFCFGEYKICCKECWSFYNINRALFVLNLLLYQ
jgi:hypothetical protein